MLILGITPAEQQEAVIVPSTFRQGLLLISAMSSSVSPLFRPSSSNTATRRYLNRINAKHGLSLNSYAELYHWSTESIDHFWDSVWDETGIIGSKGDHVVDSEAKPSENVPWFARANLNFAENMLQYRSSDKIALVQASQSDSAHFYDHHFDKQNYLVPLTAEPTPEYLSPLKRCTYAELYTLVADLVSAMLNHGVKPGDRVASYSSNSIETVAVCLAAIAIGGVWCSTSSDFGPEGVLER